MKYLSVCSGIEAGTVAWHPIGFEAVAYSEIEPFPCAVLALHYPNVPNLGDMTNYANWNIPSIDLLAGGTPCQSFSVAGLRKGLDDPRGNLALTFLAILDRFRPKWVVWENVPGVLSSVSHPAPDPLCPPDPLDVELDGQEVDTADAYESEELHAFQCFLAGLSELGYGWAYRILDAQYFGVPQRRRRPFVVGYLGDWKRPAAVLFERHCLQGHPAPSRQAGKGIAPTISSRPSGGGGLGTDFDLGGGLIVGTLNVRDGGGCGPEGPDAAYAICVCAGSLQGNLCVRRLTPRECERLQGFPDDYTLVPFRGKPACDGPRYKAIGNSWAVPCARWIGERLKFVDSL